VVDAPLQKEAPSLITHHIHLSDGPLHLRPMSEADWGVLLRWNNDPEVLYYSEGGDVTSWTLADMQAMYRAVSRHAYVFIIELRGTPIGACWLQEMNIRRVLERYPGRDVRRIDLMIGDKHLWGQGWGTRTIGLLVRFAFEHCRADLIYEPEIGTHNPRSLGASRRNAFRVVGSVPQPSGAKAPVAYDLALTRSR